MAETDREFSDVEQTVLLAVSEGLTLPSSILIRLFEEKLLEGDTAGEVLTQTFSTLREEGLLQPPTGHVGVFLSEAGEIVVKRLVA